MKTMRIYERARHGRWLRRVRGAWAVAGLMLWGAQALAQPAPNAPATSTGNYTVAYSFPCGGCQQHWLEEKVGSGAWQYAGVGSVAFTGKPAGTYYYRVAAFYFDAFDPGWSYTGSTTYGPQTAVTVAGNASPLDSLEKQLTYRYEVRRGDINGDGRVDLFLGRTSGGTARNGALENVILSQQSNGRFSSLVPSSAQLATARSWPAATATLDLRDVNADGFVDIVVKGVAGAVGASGALNQIVFSPGRTLGHAPLGVRAIDSSLKQFASNVYNYLADPQYFANTAPLYVQTTTVWSVWCSYGYGYGYAYGDYSSSLPDCHWTPQQVVVVTRDYSVFNPSAVTIWSQESAIHGSTQTRAGGQSAIKSTVEQMLAVPVGGWDLTGRSDEAGSLDDLEYGRGFELFVALLGIGTAEGSEAPRRSDLIYVTGRRVIGWLPFMHTALEYNRATVSAYDSDRRTLGNGVLVSERNWAGDFPHLMMTLGTASRASTAASLYWTQLVAADSRYRDNLPYSPTPRSGEGRYNSNGYVSGIVRATGGTTSVNMNRYTGGGVPVPATAFN